MALVHLGTRARSLRKNAVVLLPCPCPCACPCPYGGWFRRRVETAPAAQCKGSQALLVLHERPSGRGTGRRRGKKERFLAQAPNPR